ncbi:hypothetical protein P186_1980 [Pyrobaculum ferrireducens]|uniref:Uncharacterized protein n=1 Tax=Pyrobaculum ferrireducens TaxID=1104324 RepID=G7VI21_9CREN|nr:hypothetical protein P186_1980 [Pyrobaculum ferrireducens]
MCRREAPGGLPSVPYLQRSVRVDLVIARPANVIMPRV